MFPDFRDLAARIAGQFHHAGILRQGDIEARRHGSRRHQAREPARRRILQTPDLGADDDFAFFVDQRGAHMTLAFESWRPPGAW